MPCGLFAYMYPVNEPSLVAHGATPAERKVIKHWAATVPAARQKYVRWMRMYGIIVFVADPDYWDKAQRSYSAWTALNTNIVVDQVQCEIHAYPKD